MINAKQTTDIIEIRKAGLKALLTALGPDNVQTFLSLFRGSGDFTKERHEFPERSNEEIFAEMMKIQEEAIKAGEVFI